MFDRRAVRIMKFFCACIQDIVCGGLLLICVIIGIKIVTVSRSAIPALVGV